MFSARAKTGFVLAQIASEREPAYMSLAIDPTRTAVLSMDLQTWIVATYVKDRDRFITRVNALLQSARQAGALVVHVSPGFRPGMPEVSPRNALFSGIKAVPERRRLFEGELSVLDCGVIVNDEDICISKLRVRSSTRTDLKMVLRARDIDTLILFGIATHGVILSTTLHASDADYRMFIVEDCCAELDAELHRNLFEKVYAARATIVDAEELIATLDARQA